MEKLRKLPVPLLPTMVGACTLSNIYASLGYIGVRHITMIAASIIWLLFVIRTVTQWNVFKEEYSKTVPSSLYAGFTMIMMILGSYYFEWFPIFGKTLWFLGIILHAIHIVIFSYRNILRNFKKDTFVPSYFVTYNGIMVSAVVGKSMNEPELVKWIVYYGICIFTILIPFMVYRLISTPIKEEFYHTQAILLAPSSLCLVSYLGISENGNGFIVGYLYLAVLLALIFILYKLPKFFSFDFKPGFAGMTFPMAIGTLASINMAKFLIAKGFKVGLIIQELAGIQIYITTGIIFFVLLRFYMWMREV